DVIVAQGTEAGGHTGRVGTLALVPQVVDAVAPLPVIAAGGIADGRGLAAALLLGAEGAWLGTAFLASPESGYREAQKQRVLAIAAGDTVLTRSFDLAGGGEWPEGIAGRVARNAFSDRWAGHEDELIQRVEEIRPGYREAVRAGDLETAPTWAGDAAGLVRRSESAAEIMRRILAEAESVLRTRTAAVLG
ncbi:MAG TPA: nitronate monooxygenase, partial [Dehalococcoidia bacterium]|nr:nitronate monooxygenase [Dehalococcoidia bacterium]